MGDDGCAPTTGVEDRRPVIVRVCCPNLACHGDHSEAHSLAALVEALRQKCWAEGRRVEVTSSLDLQDGQHFHDHSVLRVEHEIGRVLAADVIVLFDKQRSDELATRVYERILRTAQAMNAFVVELDCRMPSNVTAYDRIEDHVDRFIAGTRPWSKVIKISRVLGAFRVEAIETQFHRALFLYRMLRGGLRLSELGSAFKDYGVTHLWSLERDPLRKILLPGVACAMFSIELGMPSPNVLWANRNSESPCHRFGVSESFDLPLRVLVRIHEWLCTRAGFVSDVDLCRCIPAVIGQSFADYSSLADMDPGDILAHYLQRSPRILSRPREEEVA